MPLEKVERNFVADAHNWEQRVRGEMESARIWEANWGPLLEKNGDESGDTTAGAIDGMDYEAKLKQLAKQIEKIPKESRLMTNSQMSYRGTKPFSEWGPNFKKKDIKRVFDEELLDLWTQDEEEGGIN